MPSPLTGHSGNVEFLLYARTPDHDAAPASVEIDTLLDAAVDEAHGTTAAGEA
jgi:hypothetical protein